MKSVVELALSNNWTFISKMHQHVPITGAMELGNDIIDPNSDDWKRLAGTIKPNGIIILYGCNVAADDTKGDRKGKNYIDALARIGKRLVKGFGSEIIDTKYGWGAASSYTGMP